MVETVPFEGVEKRLVIQFANGMVHYDDDIPLGVGAVMKSPLRITTEEWQSVLDYASCEIVSQKHLASSKASSRSQMKSPAMADADNVSSNALLAIKSLDSFCADTTELKKEPCGLSAARALAGEEVKVYLLSESTLTVWSTGFLMKTCGRTTPFLAMKRLLDLYRCKSLKDLHVSWMTYSRLDFLYPQYQPMPHQNFPQEVRFAQQYFTPPAAHETFAETTSLTAATSSSASTVGTKNAIKLDNSDDQDNSSDTASTTASDDSPNQSAVQSPQLNLPTTVNDCGVNASSFPSLSKPEEIDTSRANVATSCPSGLSYAAIPAGEHTMFVMFAAPELAGCDTAEASGYAMEEVLMTGIREDCVRELTGADNTSERDAFSNAEISQKSMIHRELAKSATSVLDEFWFNPCGYSANVLFDNTASLTVDYFSTHISPEPCSSYASLEVGTWGGVSSFCRQHQEFSMAALIAPFQPHTRNFTRIVITPTQSIADHSENNALYQQHGGFVTSNEPSSGEARGNEYVQVFQNPRFNCVVTHSAS